jgi:two-component sensor histidine kinase/PAS domain-containing protein
MISMMNLLTLAMTLAVLISLVSGIYQTFFQRAAVARWGGAAILGMALNLLCYLVLWLHLLPGQTRVLAVVQVFAYLLLNLGYLVFIFLFSGHADWLNKNTLPLICAIPLVIMGALVWQWGKIPLLVDTRGTAFALHFGDRGSQHGMIEALLYGYSLLVGLLTGSILLSMLGNSTVYYRKTISGLLGATLLTMLSSVLEFSGIQLFAHASIQQFTTAVCVIPVFLFVFSWKMTNTTPIGRQILLETMHEGYLILDQQERLVDFNPALSRILGQQARVKIGLSVEEVWAKTELRQLLPGGIPQISDPVTYVESQDWTYEVTASALENSDKECIGRMIVFHNRTGWEKLEESLHQKTDEIARSNKIMCTLADITTSLQSAVDTQIIISSMADHLKAIGLTSFTALVEGDADELVVRGVTVEPIFLRAVEKLLKIKVDGYRLDRQQFRNFYEVVGSKAVRYLDDGLGNNSFFLNVETSWLNAHLEKGLILRHDPAIVMPLVASDKVIGLVCVWGEDLDEGDVAPFRIFATQVAWLIEKANLHRADQRRLEELSHSNSFLEALSRVSSMLVATRNSQLILDTLGNELEKIGLACAITSLNEDQTSALIRYLSLKPHLIELIEKTLKKKIILYQIPIGRWPGLRMLSGRKPIWYSNPAEVFLPMFPDIPGEISRRLLHGIGFQENDQICFLPLISQEKLIGVMPIWGQNLSPADDPALIVFSNQVAGILAGAGDFEKEMLRTNALARLNDLLLALSRVATRINKTANFPEMMDLLGSELKAVGIQCMVGLLDEARENLKVEYLSVKDDMGKIGVFKDFWPEEVILPRRLWPTDKAITEKKPTWDQNLLGKLRTMFPFIPPGIFDFGVKLIGAQFNQPSCYLPMIVDDNVIGILAVWGPGLEEMDLPALATFANQLAISVENGKLYNQAQLEISERIAVEKQIREMLSEKDVLLKEIHHRVKNNLQIISSLLSLQTAQMKDPQMKTILRESQNRVRSMALIHEKLYQSADLVQVDFEVYLKSLVHSLAQTYQVHSPSALLRVEAEKIFLDIDTAIPCGLIVNELVSNSLKYAFPEGTNGMISVSCVKSAANDRHVLTITDDGVGLPADFDLERCDSLGLKLVTGLVSQISGNLEIDTRHGTQFEIVF